MWVSHTTPEIPQPSDLERTSLSVIPGSEWGDTYIQTRFRDGRSRFLPKPTLILSLLLSFFSVPADEAFMTTYF